MPSPAESSKALESDFQTFLYEGAVMGVSRGKASHLLDKMKWWDSLNFRFAKGKITQIPSLKPYLSLPGGDVSAVQVLTAVNVNGASAQLVALSETNLYEVNTVAKSATAVGTAFASGEVWMRWAWFADANNLYFTNPSQQVQKYTPGSGVSDLITMGTSYGALYMTNFHNHLVLANTKDAVNGTLPNRIAWSDVNEFNDFDPTNTNEADFFDLEQQAGNAPNGAMITGLAKLGNSLFIYTSTSIWQMQYVGLPNVMLTQARIRDVGCYYPYALASVLDQHYFIGAGGFYTFDGTTVRSFGEDIWEYFSNDLNDHYIYQNKTHAIVDYVRQEIVWFYCSKASLGAIDKAIVYNVVENTFFPIEGRGVMSQQNTTIRSFRTIDQLPSTIDSLSGSIDALGQGTPFTYSLFGTNGGFIRREVSLLDTDFSDVLPESQPFLETGDIHYGNLGVVKEMTNLRLDAGYSKGAGVQVSLYGRFYINERYSAYPEWQSNQFYNVNDIVSFEGKFWQKINIVAYPIGALSTSPNHIRVLSTEEPKNVSFAGDIAGTATSYYFQFIGDTDGIHSFLADTYGVGPGDDTALLYSPKTSTINFQTDPFTFVDVNVTTILDTFPPNAPDPNQAKEWQIIGYDLGQLGFTPFGIWRPEQFRIPAGWVNQRDRNLRTNVNRVHRLRFTFLGPTNPNAQQPQGAIFNGFEEKIYVSPSEL